MRVGGAEGDPEGDGRRTLANGWESRLWRLEDKHLREGSSVGQFGRPRPLRIRHRRRRRYSILLLCCSIPLNQTLFNHRTFKQPQGDGVVILTFEIGSSKPRPNSSQAGALTLFARPLDYSKKI